MPAILAGLAAAIAGGIAWGLIVKSTDYEIGFAAWGLGFLTGAAVLTATRGARGLPLQAIAIVCALLGILLGKYLAFVWVLQDSAEDLNVSVFSSKTFDLFRDNLDIVFDWIDLLWVGFAVYTAWRALQPEGPKPVETRTEAEPPAAEPPAA
ncbi:MAG: hypothetical protein AABM30_11665 [Actinomycetota bacterium]